MPTPERAAKFSKEHIETLSVLEDIFDKMTATPELAEFTLFYVIIALRKRMGSDRVQLNITHVPESAPSIIHSQDLCEAANSNDLSGQKEEKIAEFEEVMSRMYPKHREFLDLSQHYLSQLVDREAQEDLCFFSAYLDGLISWKIRELGLKQGRAIKDRSGPIREGSGSVN